MKIFRLLALCALVVASQAQAQQASSAPATSDAVRDALAKKDGDADTTSLLKDTLTAVDKQYTLIRKGKVQLNYDVNYSFIGQEKINTDLSSGTATLFSIENTSSHTITNTLMADYGVRNNLTANVTMPFISRYSDAAGYSGVSHTIGDIGVGVRWQPLEAKRDETTFTLTGGLRVASGTSPFKVDPSKGLATGSGIHMGFAYALSYKVTTSFSFQESISARSTLTFDQGKTAKTGTQSAGVLSVGAGYRISPKTTLNLTVGAGLTTSAPNMSVSLGLPLSL
jgi:opacity protein-like surface antigen